MADAKGRYAARYAELGLALTWTPSGEKGPRHRGWNLSDCSDCSDKGIAATGNRSIKAEKKTGVGITAENERHRRVALCAHPGCSRLTLNSHCEVHRTANTLNAGFAPSCKVKTAKPLTLHAYLQGTTNPGPDLFSQTSKLSRGYAHGAR